MNMRTWKTEKKPNKTDCPAFCILRLLINSL